jgi:hypothetical protein
VSHRLDMIERAIRDLGVATRSGLDAALPGWTFDPPLSWTERRALRQRFPDRPGRTRVPSGRAKS